MINPQNELKKLAISAYRQLAIIKQRENPISMGDDVLDEMKRVSSMPSEVRKLIDKSADLILKGIDIEALPNTHIVAGILASAKKQIFLLQLPDDEENYVRVVLDNFDELKRAINGELITNYIITGYTSIALTGGRTVQTPWGVLKAIPKVRPSAKIGHLRHPTSCILIEQRLVPTEFVSKRNSDREIDATIQRSPKSHYLFPLSCALASKDEDGPIGAIETWSTKIISYGLDTGVVSFPMTAIYYPYTKLDNDTIKRIETLSKIINVVHQPNIDISASRLISAIKNYFDSTYALIDAVMAWENLFGTGTEVTFRVTTAIAKMLEETPAKRKELQKKLSDIYGIRSRLVHGSEIKRSVVDKASKTAMGITIRVLREFYNRGPEWIALQSHERSTAMFFNE